MKANIYLHIGLHKTGTTSIQATLFKNRKKLLAHGINYLPLSKNHSTTLYPLLIAEPEKYLPNRVAGIDTAEKAAKKNAATDAALRRELSSNSCNSVVISGEDLSALSPERLQRLKDKLASYAARFRVIVYIREPHATVTSMFQQRLRRGQTYDQVIANPPSPRYSRIGAAIEVFGRENVDIRLFDAARFVNGDLIADFLAAIGAAPGLAKQLDVERANVALSHEAALLLHEINKRHREGKGGRSNVERSPSLQRWLAKIPGQPFRAPPEFFVAAQPLIDEDLRWLRALLGNDLFPQRLLQPDPQPQWSTEALAGLALLLNELIQRDARHDVKARFMETVDALRRLIGAPR